MTDYYSNQNGEFDKMAGEHKAVRLIAGGVVQGVGFRWFVKRVADDYGVKGFVRNLPDGSVETVAEGDKSAIHGFVSEIKVGPSSARVSGVSIDWIEYEGKYDDFDIIL
jgi:acylphosphatase